MPSIERKPAASGAPRSADSKMPDVNQKNGRVILHSRKQVGGDSNTAEAPPDIGCVRRPSSVRLCLRPPAVEFTRLSYVWTAGGGCAPPVISKKTILLICDAKSALCSCMVVASMSPPLELPALIVIVYTMIKQYSYH